MKRALVLILFISCFVASKAADTTTVTTHSKVVIKTNPSVGVTEYPSKVEFPDSGVQYRKVYMYLEFGCAPGLKCGEWDYGNHIYLKKNGVRHELARFITPYGFYWNSSMNWKHGWYYDLTDFSYLLHDSVEIIYQHSGYEGNTDRGWTVTMDYHFVEGVPARIPEGFQTMYQLNAPYGNVNNPFSNVVTEQNFTMPTDADMVSFKTIQTGHGMDQQENCSEFCNKERTIYLDNQVISKQQVWRNDCGWNSLYPQAGTWIYDRAGWCPGAPVIPDDKFLLLSPGTNHSFQIKMQDYSNTAGGSANYVLTSYALFFKDNRKQIDAAIEDIIAPSEHFDYLRYNPICGAPLIKVRNMGKDTLKRLVFDDGKLGGKVHSIWVPCNIAPFESGTVELEAVYDWSGAGNTFFATITKVNDMVDEYLDDNTAYSTIKRSPVHPNKVYIVFKSNNAPTENSYKLTDAKGNIIVQKSGFAANTIYRDTVYLGNNICYTFEFSDEGNPPSSNPLNEDGLDWWANPNDGTGYIQLRNGNSNAMLKNFNADFGTKHLYQFMTTFNMSVDNIDNNDLQVDIYPNPGNGFSNIHIESINGDEYAFTIYDSSGKEIKKSENLNGTNDFTLDGLAAGVYTLVLYQSTGVKSVHFVIQ
ncbi:MAG: T9SS type A sorting domain-containing protein [Bacteroidia bacterium]|nr:T9SS type A sorting domain-containing protein [Bacteroidia bacterium]